MPVALYDEVGIGGHQAALEYFDGRIDELRIYDRALSPDEIQAIFMGAMWTRSYCFALPNSAGTLATISASGSASIAAQDLALTAHGLPPGVSGILYYGTAQENQPFGDGVRCVGGAVQRLPFNQADGNGVLSEPDVFALPMPNVPLTPGTLNFQAWYRDSAAMMSGFNLSDGLSIQFTP